MKAKRVLVVSGAGVAILLVLAAGAASLPQVQTWAARRALASACPGSTLEGVSAGLGRMSVRGLRLEHEGAVLTVPDADADLGVVSALLGRGYLVRNLVARGWTLDLARSSPPGAVAPPGDAGTPWQESAAGAVLAAFNVPAGLSLDKVDLQGVIILPDDGGSPAGTATVVISGGGLAAGQEGRFTCNVTAKVEDPAAPVGAVKVRAAFTAAMDEAGTFTRADLQADATASGRDFPQGVGISCAASAARASGKTRYAFALVRAGVPIASVDADSPDRSRRLSGSWKLDLRDSDVAPFMIGRRLPAFSAAGAGTYALDAASRDVRAEGRIRGTASRLGVVARGLAALGRVDLAADFDIARSGASLRVDRLETRLSGEHPAASVTALQPFEFNVETGELKVARPSGDLVGISVTGLPLAWLKGVLPGLELAGPDLSGEFAMRAEDGRLALRTKAPLQSPGVAASAAGRALGSGLDVSAFVLADYSPQGWQVQLSPLAVRSGGIRMLSIEARLGRLNGRGQAVKAAGSWSASLALLSQQPFAGRLPRIEAGDASGSFEANLGADVRALRIKLEAKGVSLAGGSRALPAVESDVRIDVGADGRTTFSVPLRLDYGAYAANLVYAGTLTRQATGARVDATLTADTVNEEDFPAVAVLAGAGAFISAPEPAAPGDAEAGARPAGFWPSVPGRLSYSLGTVSLAPVQLRDVRGVVVSAPGSVRVELGTAVLGDKSAVRYDGELDFDPGAASPCSFKASVGADGVDSAPLFRGFDPDKPPAVEGRFDLQAHLAGSAGAPRDLLRAVQGDCRLSSKDGLFRALRVDAIDSVRQAPSAIVNALDTVSSLFGRKSGKLGEALVAAASGLSEIHYDQMSVSAVRGADLDVRLTDISLIAPEERIEGTGRIAHAEGVPYSGQALSIDLDVGVRGKLGGVLGFIGMLKDGSDELGYTHFYQPVHLGGTLGNIDYSQWKDMLVQAPLRKGGGLIDKLLGK